MHAHINKHTIRDAHATYMHACIHECINIISYDVQATEVHISMKYYRYKQPFEIFEFISVNFYRLRSLGY